MNAKGYLCRRLFQCKWTLLGQTKKFQLLHNVRQRSPFNDYYDNQDNIKTSLWFTNLPSRKKRAISLDGKKKIKSKSKVPLGPILIECKRKEFNHHHGTVYGKFEAMPLASKGWHHRKSNGDFFTILPTTEHPAFLAPRAEDIPYTFEDTKLSTAIIEQLKNTNVEYPTSIQAKAIPAILEGKSVLMAAETGCGKTLAYLTPIVDKILRWKELVLTKCNAPFAVIILPTRELAIQVGLVAQKLCSDLDVNCMTLIGGRTKKILLDPFKAGIDVLICSPGVLSKLLTHGIMHMNHCKHFVIDEADTLLDDTFSSKVKYIIMKSKLKFGNISLSPDKSQLCLVSATLPKDIESKLQDIIYESGLELISTQYLHKIQPHITQQFIRVSPSRKPEELLKIVMKNVKQGIPTMIFSNRAKTCKWIHLFLAENNIKSIEIHSEMRQETRLEKYQTYRDGLVNVISCTDIASRGLDCTRTKHVVNYEFPMFVSDYIHRCGRTGRIGHDKNCLVTSFVTYKKELPLVHSIEKSARTSCYLENVNNNKINLIMKRINNQDNVKELITM